MENLKRPAVVLNLILIALLAFLLLRDCNEPKPEPELEVNDFTVTNDDIKKMKDSNLISLNSAVKMYKKYDKLRLKFTKDSLKGRYGKDFKDTRMVWFDIKTIRTYLKYLETSASDAEGIGFYFGVNAGNAPKGKNHQSFFMAPTIENEVAGKKVQSGFTYDDKGNRVFLYKEYDRNYVMQKNPKVQEASFLNLRDHHDGLILNEGTPNPPGGSN